jgi:1,4-alpha-glucan branching enzyme
VPDEAALRAAAAVLLLAPAPPLLFMGEEWAATEPFPWFCDFEPELAARVYAHRSREFPGSADPADRATYASAHLDWRRRDEPPHAQALEYHRQLLAIRHREIVPLIPQLGAGRCTRSEAGGAFGVDWAAGEQVLHLSANLTAARAPPAGSTAGRVIFATQPGAGATPPGEHLAPWSVVWRLEHRRESR